jgi:hypothetical protein
MGKGDKRRQNDIPKWVKLPIVIETSDLYGFRDHNKLTFVYKKTVDTWFDTIGKLKGLVKNHA